jgi:hypothetical protein
MDTVSRGCEAFAGEEAQESRLAGAVRTYEEGSRSRREFENDVLQTERVVGELVGEVTYRNRGREGLVHGRRHCGDRRRKERRERGK